MTAAYDPDFNAAVLAICANIFPTGFDVSENAPDSFEALCSHLDAGHKMVVSPVYGEDPAFADAHTFQAFRAWHDWTHYTGGFAFTLAGECAAARAQRQQLAMLHGEDKANEWMGYLHSKIIVDNFDADTVCPYRIG